MAGLMSRNETFSCNWTREGSSLARALTMGWKRKRLGCFRFTCHMAGCEIQKNS